MSKTLEAWSQIETPVDAKTGQTLSDYYTETFGRFFSNGLNIGREVTSKLKSLKKSEDDSNVWPTLLQAEGLDSGLTAGFLTACGICTIDEQENPLRHLPEAMDRIFGVSVEMIEIIDHEQLVAEYPDYAHYPNEQQWSFPAVMIHYSVDA